MQYFDDEETTGTNENGGGDGNQKMDEGKTALVDSSLCPGMKPGDEFTVRVEKVLDSGEYQISYPGESEKEEPMETEAAPAPESEMSAYMS